MFALENTLNGYDSMKKYFLFLFYKSQQESVDFLRNKLTTTLEKHLEGMRLYKKQIFYFTNHHKRALIFYKKMDVLPGTTPWREAILLKKIFANRHKRASIFYEKMDVCRGKTPWRGAIIFLKKYILFYKRALIFYKKMDVLPGTTPWREVILWKNIFYFILQITTKEHRFSAKKMDVCPRKTPWREAFYKKKHILFYKSPRKRQFCTKNGWPSRKSPNVEWRMNEEWRMKNEE